MAVEQGALAKQKLEKLARMELAGIQRHQTSAAMGVSESRISQLIDTEEYKVICENIASESFHQNELMNKGWDGVEGLGLKTVIDALQSNPDPEFALRAAVVANKATRRGGIHNNTPIQAAGAKAIIHLNANFTQKIQQNFNVSSDNKNDLLDNKKDTNFLGAKAVQDLLKIPGVDGEVEVKYATNSDQPNPKELLSELNI